MIFPKFVHVSGDLDYILHFKIHRQVLSIISKILFKHLKSRFFRDTHNLLGLARVKKARILIASSTNYGDPLWYIKQNFTEM